MKPVMTLTETDTTYYAKVNCVSVSVNKDVVVMKNGIKQHPRLLAIDTAAQQANIDEWLLLNT